MRYFVLELTEKDGTISVHSKNDGFNPLELAGLLSWKHNDIIAQITGKFRPDIVKRELVEEETQCPNTKNG